MDWSAITQVISSIGFPIAMCLILAFYINKNDERYDKTLADLKTSVDNNTIALTRLMERMDVHD